MKRTILLLSILAIFQSCKNDEKSNGEKAKKGMVENKSPEVNEQEDSYDLDIKPISHATAVFNWGKETFYTDPVGGAEAFANAEKPDFVLITDIHGDHMNAETLQGLELDSIKIIVPQAVKEDLPQDLQANLIVLANGENYEIDGFHIKAIPMYNLPQTKDAMHVKGRGNGYLVEKDGFTLYISGDTEDIPEMRNLENIDVALVSMNLPYTMTVEDAAAGVLAFQPKKVIPYHYRGKNGLADIEKFKKIVNEGNSKIQVELLDWYPEM
ncbi:MBL fold metallo-hydrolase [Gramella sp. AN32]|uniref:MBL fold metallo-hydrolase n=1 Tax=Christiangramia antarctica TaxID=2058158 RepID=A0ABW5X7N8_9FLAO|nr:MBL fold metallo-hydrolase [Gramella sp. AN32]MCM4154483.1 MBL fold metallo-hydrolase [Gramella sp. AN32]